MITVYYQNKSGQGCVIRPTPLIAISTSPIRNGLASYGSSYTITLTGTLLAQDGSPVYSANGDGAFGPDGKFNQIGPNWNGTSDQKPAHETVAYGNRLSSIFDKQSAIRELFAMDGQKMEISPITGDGPIMVCFPSVESVAFEEGIYVDICRYTVTLNATSLMDENGSVYEDGIQRLTHSPDPGSGDGGGAEISDYQTGGRRTEVQILDEDGGFVSDVQDSWALEPDNSLGNTTDSNQVIPLGYRLSRTVTATGLTKYIADFNEGDTATPKRYEAWEMARNYVHKRVIQPADNGTGTAGSSNYPYYQALQMYGSGFIDLEHFSGYSHARTENIDQAAGSYTITDSWLLASGTTAFEQYTMSINSSVDATYTQVSIEGTIRGATDVEAKEQVVPPPSGQSPYDRALTKYWEISNTGEYGLTSDIYKRANSATEVVLNATPRGISLATNEFTGEITYSVSFDNRPTNIFTGVIGETISVNDTYPGDVFASIPVLGRLTGPVLQYIDTRTEYKRDVSISMQLDYTNIGYGKDRANLMLTKPSLIEPTRSELNNTIAQLSPANEPGIVKYFVSPPSESWNPRTGSYSINISWTYELDQ